MNSSVLAMLAVLSAATGAEPSATFHLEAPAVPADAPIGYGRAVLTVIHDLPAPVAAAAIRAHDGGPAFVTALVAPPSRPARQAVALPATSAEQTYVVDLFTFTEAPPAASPLPAPAARGTASITWPPDQVSGPLWIAPDALDMLAAAPADWPVEFRQQLLIALAGMVILLCFVMLARRPAYRAAWAAAVAAGGVSAMVGILGAVASPAASAQELLLIQRGRDGRTRLETISVVSARRHLTYTHHFPTPARALYADRDEMADDEAVAIQDGPTPTATMTLVIPMVAGETRLFVHSELAPPDIPRPGAIDLSLDEAADQWIIQPSRDTPGGVLIADTQVAPVSATARRTRRRVDRGELRPIHTLFAHPERYGFEDNTRGLLHWWARNHQCPGRVYLLWPDRLPDGPAIYAVEL